MSREPIVVLEVTRIEAAHLAGIVAQFLDLLEASSADGSRVDDPAVARLVPDAYPDDASAARDFRAVTQPDLLERRASDAATVLATLGRQPDVGDIVDADAISVLTVRLDEEQTRAWMRTLAALRLVLATRLGIEIDDAHEPDDPRFGVYDWLGFRLDGLVQAVEVG